MPITLWRIFWPDKTSDTLAAVIIILEISVFLISVVTIQKYYDILFLYQEGVVTLALAISLISILGIFIFLKTAGKANHGFAQ